MNEVKNAIAVAQGIVDETQTITNYLTMIKESATIDVEAYGEIIADEMDHILKFFILLSEYTGLETKEYQVINKGE